ncbi:hypothetical protein LguiB_005682 [Lonicera macranthoides]
MDKTRGKPLSIESQVSILEGDDKIGEAEAVKEKDVDYLSSVEVKLGCEYKGVLPKVLLQVRQEEKCKLLHSLDISIS